MSASIVRGVLSVLAIVVAALSLRAEPPADPAAEGTYIYTTAPAPPPDEFPHQAALPDVDKSLIKALHRVRREVRLKDELYGHIDWSARTIVAVGDATQVGRGSQAALKANRAAEVVALRNAMALAAGLRIGPNGQIDQLPRGKVVLEGYLKDFEVTRSFSREVGGKTVWTAEARVPMFGVKHVAGRLYEPQARAYRELEGKLQRGRWAAPAEAAAVFGDVLVIDARGTGLAPSMYPLVRSADGRILIDMQTMDKAEAIERGPVAFATTTLKAEELAATAAEPASAPAGGAPHHPRRHAVAAVNAAGDGKTELIIDDAAAGKMLADPALAALVRQGRVVILIDDR